MKLFHYSLVLFRPPYTRKRFPAFLYVSSNELLVRDSLENGKLIQKRRKTFPCVRGLRLISWVFMQDDILRIMYVSFYICLKQLYYYICLKQ